MLLRDAAVGRALGSRSRGADATGRVLPKGHSVQTLVATCSLAGHTVSAQVVSGPAGLSPALRRETHSEQAHTLR